MTNLEKHQSELFQILRFHKVTTDVRLKFTAGDGGVPAWYVEVIYRNDVLLYDWGTRLERRLEKAVRVLKEKFKDGVYTYERYSDKPY